MGKVRFDEVVVKKLTVTGDSDLRSQVSLAGVALASGFKGKGKTFYADPRNGNDNYDGLTPATAKVTTQAAIDLCTNRQMDTVIRLNGTESLTTPLLFNKLGITLIGEDSGWAIPGKGERFMYYGASGVAVATITQPCTIIGVGFSGQFSGAGSYNVCIDATDSDGWIGCFTSIFGCRFTTWGTQPNYALWLKGSNNCHIEGNHFDGNFEGFANAAIGLGASNVANIGVANSRFINNYFTHLKNGNYAFEAMASSYTQGCFIGHNVMVGKDGADAEGAPGVGAFFNHAGTGAYGTILYDNYIPLANTSAYSDTIANLKTAGYQFVGNHYTE